MANEIPPLVLEIKLEIDKLKSQMSQVENEFKKVGNAARAQGGGLEAFAGKARNMLGVLGVTTSIAGFVSYLKQAGHAAAEDAKSFEIMARQLEVSTGATRGMSKSIDDQIGKLSMMSGVVDDKIRMSYSKLVAVTGDSTKALELQKLALDIAAAKGKDVSAVTMALSRAYMGNETALNRLAPEVKNVTDKIGYLQRTTQGMAAVAANTDPYTRLTVIFGEMQEKIGYALLPEIQKLADYLASDEFQNVWSDIATEFSNFVTGLDVISTAVGDAVTNINTALSKVNIPILTTIVSWLLKLIPGVNILNGIRGLGKDAQAADAQANIMPGTLQEWQYLQSGKKTTTTTPPPGKPTDPAAQLKKDLAAMKTYIAGAQQDILDTQNKYDKAVANAQADFAKAQAAAVKDRNDALAELEKSHAASIISINKSFTKQLNDIVQQSMDRLRTGFSQAASIDIGAMFATSLSTNTLGNAVTTQIKNGITTAVSWWGTPSATGGVGGIIDQLKTKLTASKKLIENSAALSGAGFSQTFIEQVVSQGSDMGNQIADAILTATPESQKQLQELFTETETLADSGMDSLAKAMYDKAGLATNELKKLYKTTQQELVDALADEQQAYVDAQTKIQASFNDALLAANASLEEAIQSAKDTMLEQLDKISAELDAKMAAYKGKLSDLGTLPSDAQVALDKGYSQALGIEYQPWMSQLGAGGGGTNSRNLVSASVGGGPDIYISNTFDSGGAPLDQTTVTNWVKNGVSYAIGMTS